ncbi:hypothetical protein ACMA5M_20735, partial [Citrobacter farmeri]|uniref:hypothetical protein n=1 Tax=Citrobacter farmeri TaxID=67824 RepID=UPI0039BD2AC6
YKAAKTYSAFSMLKIIIISSLKYWKIPLTTYYVYRRLFHRKLAEKSSASEYRSALINPSGRGITSKMPFCLSAISVQHREPCQ